jgi:hypothetical protein
MEAEAASIPDLQTAWVPSRMTEAKIQALADCGLLQPKAEVEWKTTAGEGFLTEDVKEQVVFASFFERGFNLPVEDFFRGLLYYYKLELVHLVPNSITVVSTFIHFCEAYLGILCWGITRKIRMTTLTRVRVLNTFKYKARAQRD